MKVEESPVNSHVFAYHQNPPNPTRVVGGWCGVGNATTPNPEKAMKGIQTPITSMRICCEKHPAIKAPMKRPRGSELPQLLRGYT